MLSSHGEDNIYELQVLINYLNNELICDPKCRKGKHSPTNYYEFRGFIQTSNSLIPNVYVKCPASISRVSLNCSPTKNELQKLDANCTFYVFEITFAHDYDLSSADIRLVITTSV